MKKKKILFLVTSFLLLLVVFIFVSKNYQSDKKDKLYLRLVYILPDKIKTFIKKNIFVYDYIKKLDNELIKTKEKNNLLILNFENLLRDGKIDKINFEKISSEKIILDDEELTLNKFKTNFLVTSKNINARGTSYIDLYKNYLFLVSATGVTSVVDRSQLENHKFNLKTIKNNLKEIINYNEFFIDSKFGIKDIKIIDNDLFISYTNQIGNNCFNISILVAKINLENLKFKKFYEPTECAQKKDNFTQFNPHHSGGRIENFDENNILLSVGDFKNFSYSQNKETVFGKIILINKFNKDYQIISTGLRNPQGMYYDAENNLIISTDHGPEGGDEINLQNTSDNKIYNFGWPVSSYGEHYGFKSKDEKNLLYRIAPLHKSHIDYGFNEPLKQFTPGIGISQVVKFIDLNNKKKFLFGSMGNKNDKGKMSLHLIELDKSNKIIKHNSVSVKGRIRDIVTNKNENEIFLLIENGPILGQIKF
jgi:hypothetical protein